jgi:hypothetical protein
VAPKAKKPTAAVETVAEQGSQTLCLWLGQDDRVCIYFSRPLFWSWLLRLWPSMWPERELDCSRCFGRRNMRPWRLRLLPNRSPRLQLPSRPGEFHPEPLTDPDMKLSPHPARATPRKPCRATGKTGGPPVSRCLHLDVGDLPPLLRGHYPASSLLRGSAPLIGASVLSASWDLHLRLFL